MDSCLIFLVNHAALGVRCLTLKVWIIFVFRVLIGVINACATKFTFSKILTGARLIAEGVKRATLAPFDRYMG
jgi:hypothetical protein